ncbi:hypothetical protein Dimus_031479, partial [Dionaea muscipula]
MAQQVRALQALTEEEGEVRATGDGAGQHLGRKRLTPSDRDKAIETKLVEVEIVDTEAIKVEAIDTEAIEIKRLTRDDQVESVEVGPTKIEAVYTRPIKARPVEVKAVYTRPVKARSVEVKAVYTRPVKARRDVTFDEAAMLHPKKDNGAPPSTGDSETRFDEVEVEVTPVTPVTSVVPQPSSSSDQTLPVDSVVDLPPSDEEEEEPPIVVDSYSIAQNRPRREIRLPRRYADCNSVAYALLV